MSWNITYPGYYFKFVDGNFQYYSLESDDSNKLSILTLCKKTPCKDFLEASG